MKAAPQGTPNEGLNTPVTPQEQRAQLGRILRSEAFRLAPGLQKFLEFVVSKTIEGSSQGIKEYTVGTEVFGRTDGYDPKIDTVVRIQAHRLREKLKDYYSSEGAGDGIFVEIPKGHYIPWFSRRLILAGRELEGPQPPTSPSETPEAVKETLAPKRAPSSRLKSGRQFMKKALLWTLAGVAGMYLLLGGALLLPRLWSNHATEQPSRIRPEPLLPTGLKGPLNDLWADFLEEESSPIVAYSNAIFLTNETADLLRLKSEEVDNLGSPASRDLANRLVANPSLLEHAGPVFFEDSYTGTGEVMAVFYLTRLFSQLHSPLQVKRSRLVTTDDLMRHDVIFLGSTIEDALLAGLPLTQDFVFLRPLEPAAKWRQRISNLHPQPGESSSYAIERDPKTYAVRADYALVSFLPGMSPNRKIAILGGLTTLGTQAAADFATSPSQIAELAARLGSGPDTLHKKVPPFFQAVIRAEIMKGDILSVKYVAGHVIQAARHSPPKD